MRICLLLQLLLELVLSLLLLDFTLFLQEVPQLLVPQAFFLSLLLFSYLQLLISDFPELSELLLLLFLGIFLLLLASDL